MNDDNWIRISFDDLIAEDEITEKYKGYNISLEESNGGILGVHFSNADEIWVYSSELYESDKHHDSEWHILFAKAKIDAMMQEQQQGQQTLW